MQFDREKPETKTMPVINCTTRVHTISDSVPSLIRNRPSVSDALTEASVALPHSSGTDSTVAPAT